MELVLRFPSWAGLSVCSKGTYLGYVIGPGAQEESWVKPLRKYLAAADL